MARWAKVTKAQAGCAGWLEATTWVAILLYCILLGGAMSEQGVHFWAAWTPILGPVLGFRWIRRGCAHLVETRTRGRSPETVTMLCRMLSVGLPAALVPMHAGALILLVRWFQPTATAIGLTTFAPIGVVSLLGWLLLIRPRQLLAWWKRHQRRHPGRPD